jgi:hypothetical protein
MFLIIWVCPSVPSGRAIQGFAIAHSSVALRYALRSPLLSLTRPPPNLSPNIPQPYCFPQLFYTQYCLYLCAVGKLTNAYLPHQSALSSRLVPNPILHEVSTRYVACHRYHNTWCTSPTRTRRATQHQWNY